MNMDAIDFENHDEVMKIFDWCKNTKPLPLARLAELVPIFEENGTWIRLHSGSLMNLGIFKTF